MLLLFKIMKLHLNLFELITFHWISLAFGALLLTLLNVFYIWIIILWIIIDLMASFFLIKKKYLQLIPLKINEKIGLLVLIILALLLSFFTTPTIFGGRDEGSFSNASILLVQNHQLNYQTTLSKKLFEIYGKGKALNFPGFYYTREGNLKSQFLPGYIAWGGIFYGLFGLVGFQFINFLPWITFLFSFFLILKKLTSNKNFSLGGLLIILSLLPIILFYKFTLSEIFFASLLWFSLYLLLNYFKKKTFTNFLLIFFPLMLTPFVRIESIGILLSLFLIFLLFDFIHLKKPRYQLLFIIFALVLFSSFIINHHFFVETLGSFGKNFLPSTSLSHFSSNFNLPSSFNSFLPADWKNFYLLKVFWNYHFLSFLLLSFIYCGYLVKKKKYHRLLPLLFFFPTFIYLVNANISLDHPWMLRRFIFSIIPLSILYSYLLLDSLFTKKYSFIIYSLVTGLIVINLFQTIPFLLPSQNKPLLRKLNNFSQSFTSRDLLLISQLSSGDGWSLISAPLRNIFHLPAIYFFRPDDAHQLTTLGFKNIYLIVSPEELPLFKNISKKKIGDYQFNNQLIHSSRQSLEKPYYQEKQTKGFIYKLNL